MIKNSIKCPYCGDTWDYKYLIDYESGKAIVTSDFHIIEEWEECTCFKCHGKYRLLFEQATHKMYDFVYKAWRKVKGK